MLTKTAFLDYCYCPGYLWAKINDPDFRQSTEDSPRAQQGLEVDIEARGLFSGGQLVEGPNNQAADQTTKLAQDKQIEVIFQATVMTTNNLLAKADIIERDLADKEGWTLYEVKASSQIKAKHLIDLAFQKLAFAAAGWQINRTEIVLLNKNYSLVGQTDINELFKITNDVTRQVEDCLNRPLFALKGTSWLAKSMAGYTIVDLIEMAKSDLSRLPNDRPQCVCLEKSRSNHCPAIKAGYFHPDLPKYSIYDIGYIKANQIQYFRDRNIVDVADLVQDDTSQEQLNDRQRQQIELYPQKKLINKPALIEQLAGLKEPIFFLDYETVSQPIPFLQRSGPYWQIPFLFVIYRGVGKTKQEKHYLVESFNQPQFHQLAQGLIDFLGDEGSIVVWNQSFEKKVNRNLATIFPELADKLETINDRVYDLMEIFRTGIYQDGRFKGKFSIKKIADVLLEKNPYQSSDIKQGDEASNQWLLATQSQSNHHQRVIFQSLIKYCQADTIAAADIYQQLLKAIRPC